MMYRIFVSSLFIICLVAIVSCKIQTDIVFSNSSSRTTSTEPIYLRFSNTHGYSFHFLLKKTIEKGEKDQYFLYLRSLGERRNLLNKPTLHIIFNNSAFVDLAPISEPEIVGYEIEPYKIEEELRYKIDYATLRRMSETSKVEMKVEGNIVAVNGYFQAFNATKAVRNFLLSSY